MTTADVARAAEAIRRLRAGRHLLLLLDFDGTLTEFNPDPDAVELSRECRRLLVDLSARPDVTLGIISGRRLADVRRRTQLNARTYCAGLHGLEIEGPGVTFVHPDATRTLTTIRQLGAALASDLAGLNGVFIEDKHLSIAAHFREAADQDAARVPAIVERHVAPFIESGLLRLMHGAFVIEVLPNIDWHKGSAVAWIRELVAAEHDVIPVYVGDDVTDEDAFQAVRGVGLAIAASPGTSGADLHVDGPAAVELLLRELAAPDD
jgi:trehalose-phosphatase